MRQTQKKPNPFSIVSVRIVLLTAFLSALFSFAGCGKKGDPLPPEPAAFAGPAGGIVTPVLS